MARRSELPSAGSTARERAFVLGAIALAPPVTAVLLVLDIDRAAIGLAWLIAVAWTAVASIAAALRCGIADGDRSAFGGRGRRHGCPPDTRAESFDWNTRTGQFAQMRLQEDRARLLEDDCLRNHDAGI